MGCFDFTYADNGENIRGRNGYVYLPASLQKQAKLKNPMRFSTTDEYGRFLFEIDKENVELDIYALYTAMLASDGFVDADKWTTAYINCLTNRRFDATFETAEDEIRGTGIHMFFGRNKTIDKEKHSVEPLGNQRSKTIVCKEMFNHPLPLLISKKKLPAEKGQDVYDIAKQWGYVSTGDPNQGWAKTKNLYCIYRPEKGDER